MISLYSLYQFKSGYTTGSIPQDKLSGTIFGCIDAIKNINTIRISNTLFDTIKNYIELLPMRLLCSVKKAIQVIQ